MSLAADPSPDEDDADLSSDFEPSSRKAKSAKSSKAGDGEASTSKAVSCQFCQTKFTASKSLARHLKICKKSGKQNNLHSCLHCGKSFARRYILQGHSQRCQSKTVPSEEKGEDSKRIPCIVPGCAQDFQFKTSLYKHLQCFHQKDLKSPTHLEFPSLDAFVKWKTDMEAKSFSYYSQQYGKRDGKLYYYCQHDGNSKPHRKGREPPRLTSRKNVKGVIKKNKLCLSMISAHCQEDGSVKASFYPSHTHKCRPRDLKHQPLSAETMSFIDKQLAWSVPPRKIVLNLRDDSYKRENRKQKRPLRKENLVKVKNVTERMRKKKAKLRYSDDDANSVYMKVNILSEESFNPIVIYKPKGEKTVIGPEGSEHLPEDVFLLGIQTSDQLEMMEKHSKVILAMDETHGTNHYDYRLLNLVVKDEYNLGYPVGHLITSKSDEATIQFFYKAIKERCPEISIGTCITDDDPALINGLRSGFGEDIWHILCIWHIHRTVQAKLREYIKDPKLVDEMYQVICLLIEARTESEFHKIRESFLKEYGAVSKGFTKWFNETFMPKAPKWAMCFRIGIPHGSVETTMLVESFHNQLKTVYLKRVPNRRIDDLLDLLLQMEEDFFTRWYNAKETETLSAKDTKKIQDRHERGKKIKDEDVTHITGNFYSVRSQNKDVVEEYTVTRCSEACEETLCVFMCTSCVMCTHMYSCTCPDLTPPCKHIHKVHMMLNVDPPEPPLESIEEPIFYAADNLNLPVLPDEEAPNDKSDSLEKKIRLIKETISEVENQLENSPVKKFMLPRIQSMLTDLNSQCKLLTEGGLKDQVTVMQKQVSIGPNEKLQKQVKSFVRVKKRKKKTLQRPSRKSAAEIKQFLFQDNEDDEMPEDNDVDMPEESYVTEDNMPENTVPEELPDEAGIIQRFFNVLQLSNELLHTYDNSFSIRLYEGSANETTNIAHNKFVLLPVNHEGNWSCVAVCVHSCELIMYNPLSSPGDNLSRFDKKFLSVVVCHMRNCFPSINKWSVKRHFDYQPVFWGVSICWFAYQVTLSDGYGSSIPALADPISCKKEIDDAILAWKV